MRTKPATAVSFSFIFLHSIQYAHPYSIENASEPSRFSCIHTHIHTDGAMLRKKSKGLSFICSLLLFFVGNGGGKVNSTAYCLCSSLFFYASASCYCLETIAFIVSIERTKIKLRMFRWKEYGIECGTRGGQLVHNKSAFAKQKRTSF